MLKLKTVGEVDFQWMYATIFLNVILFGFFSFLLFMLYRYLWTKNSKEKGNKLNLLLFPVIIFLGLSCQQNEEQPEATVNSVIEKYGLKVDKTLKDDGNSLHFKTAKEADAFLSLWQKSNFTTKDSILQKAILDAIPENLRDQIISGSWRNNPMSRISAGLGKEIPPRGGGIASGTFEPLPIFDIWSYFSFEKDIVTNFNIGFSGPLSTFFSINVLNWQLIGPIGDTVTIFFYYQTNGVLFFEGVGSVFYSTPMEGYATFRLTGINGGGGGGGNGGGNGGGRREYNDLILTLKGRQHH